MHVSGRCHLCGDWVTERDAASIQPGDVIFDWVDWGTVIGVARVGNTCRIAVEGRRKPIRIGAGSTVWVATGSLRTAA